MMSVQPKYRRKIKPCAQPLTHTVTFFMETGDNYPEFSKLREYFISRGFNVTGKVIEIPKHFVARIPQLIKKYGVDYTYIIDNTDKKSKKKGK